MVHSVSQKIGSAVARQQQATVATDGAPKNEKAPDLVKNSRAIINPNMRQPVRNPNQGMLEKILSQVGPKIHWWKMAPGERFQRDNLKGEIYINCSGNPVHVSIRDLNPEEPDYELGGTRCLAEHHLDGELTVSGNQMRLNVVNDSDESREVYIELRPFTKPMIRFNG